MAAISLRQVSFGGWLQIFMNGSVLLATFLAPAIFAWRVVHSDGAASVVREVQRIAIVAGFLALQVVFGLYAHRFGNRYAAERDARRPRC